MKTVLILGISGFTGKHFQNYIQKHELYRQYEFIGVDKAQASDCKIPLYIRNLANTKELESCIVQVEPDYIVNLVGVFGSENFTTLLHINAEMSRNLFEIILKHKLRVHKLLIIGSAAEYGASQDLPITEHTAPYPVTFYGLSKLIQSQYAVFYAQNFDMPVTVARTFNVIGQGLSHTLSLGSFITQIRQAQDGDCLLVGNLATKRDFLDIEDVVDAYWKILIHGKPGQIYNVCRGQSTGIKEVLDILIALSGKRLTVSVQQDRVKQHDIVDSYGDNTLLNRHTGWTWTIAVAEALAKSITAEHI
ncbi:NAD-dependent epimerase/dehydratase [Candidatus Vecturithrix granuli]|uniref:NAD-dependent epimerase/dehydratase n=1 Tax=Vecturithrix granuli TaxID=1499967 RepID=A0A081BXV2_VECG1|nr:NAD-dependent epimerase/dehydratase [Candidatus Vecturithrix granuli]